MGVVHGPDQLGSVYCPDCMGVVHGPDQLGSVYCPDCSGSVSGHHLLGAVVYFLEYCYSLQVILELCSTDHTADIQIIQPHLDRIRPPGHTGVSNDTLWRTTSIWYGAICIKLLGGGVLI
jgi:hypothetical protein